MAHKGWKRGFISELGGTIALIAAFAAAWLYPGWWDRFIHTMTGVSLASAHVIGFAICAIATYSIVAFLGWTLERYAQGSIVAPIDAFLGSLVGVVKAGFLFWAIIYVALFFPLSPDLRNDLRHTFLIRYIVTPNENIDHNLREDLPWFVHPFVSPIFRRHEL